MGYIQRHIADLLMEHDCVVIPDFGGFVAKKRAARLDEQRHRIDPPAKEVGFNARLFHNDGLLAQDMRLREGISYIEAMQRIGSEVAWIERQLDAGRQVAFDGIGTLYRNSDKQVAFLPSGERNLLKASYGYTAVMLTPVEEGSPSDEKAAAVIAPVHEESEKNGAKRALRNLAAAAAVPFLIAAAWLVQDMNDGDQQLSLLPAAMISTPVAADYQPRIPEEDISFEKPSLTPVMSELRQTYPDLESVRYSFEEDQVSEDGVTLTLRSFAAKAADATVGDDASVSAPKGSMNLYFIVGGAFREKANAENYVNELKKQGYDASIFGRKGELHMVSVSSFASRASARKALKEIRENVQPKAWLKRK